MTPENTRVQSSKTETHKLVFELLKQLTTLSSGGSLLVIAIAEKLFPQPEWGWSVALSLVAFLVCLVSSVMMMLQLATHTGEFPDDEKQFAVTTLAIALGSFCIGVMLVVVFSLKNFL
jgi:ABC-type dipeptide/oligopeptide/nickel transport system permease component